MRMELNVSCIWTDMANIPAHRTGLNNDVYVSTRVEKHKPQMKVYSNKVGFPTVSLYLDKPYARCAGKKDLISEKDLSLVRKWIDLNYDVLHDFWDNKYAYTEDFLADLKGI